MTTRMASAFALIAIAAAAAGCGGGAAPALPAPQDQVAQVGTELSIELHGTDPDGDLLRYSFDADVPDIRSRATLQASPAGSGIFRWTPLSQDVGLWYFDFTVTDGDHDTTVTIQIDVRSAVGQNSAPVFRAPLGTGTTLDLESSDCIDLDILVEDQDSTSVVISQEEPAIEGATLTGDGGLGATWRWCPTRAQIAAEDRYLLLLSADDLQNPPTQKSYLIVLRSPANPDCPGEGPVITHSPEDQTTLVNLTIDATITDDLGLKTEPLFYYSESPPANPPDLGAMTQLTMLLIDGDMRDGVWAADVPNPVVGGGAGDSADLYYVIVADDDDDSEGDCDHVTQSPASGAHHVVITNPGGTGGGGLCQSCTADIQCGDSAADLCVRVGAENQSFCLLGCSGAGDCPADFVCSASPVTSVDGATGTVCVPASNDCANPAGTTCTDDDLEENDSRPAAAANPPLAPGVHQLVSCEAAGGTGDDEDFFRIEIDADTQVTLDLAGGSASDLDLQLQRADGTVLGTSGSFDSEESISACLTPGSYFVRVYAFGAQENGYALTYAGTAANCALVCQDDENEPDDDATEARPIDYPVHDATTQAICAGDDDWYEVLVYDSEHVTVDLTFEQTTSTEDLDLHFVDSTGLDLTPCLESAPSTCTAAQGQGTSSNEHYEFTAPSSGCDGLCTYYVVVHGWDGSTNLYDIRIQVQ
jgi:pre-peptidase